MRSNQVPFVDGTNIVGEKCIRNKRKFSSETRPSLGITNQGSPKTEKMDSGIISMSSFKLFQNSLAPSNSTESHDAQHAHHQEQKPPPGNSGDECQIPKDLLPNFAHCLSNQDVRVQIPIGHDQLCKYLDVEAGNWDIDTERQLEDLLMKYLEILCNDAVKKVASYGYNMEEAKRAVLKVGYSYHVRDALFNLGEKALVYLAGTSSEETDIVVSDFKELHKLILAEMVRALRDVRPALKRGDALWCLIVSDMNISQACMMQKSSILPMDSSSLLKHLVMSNDVCLPAADTPLQLVDNTKVSSLTVGITNSSVSNQNATVEQFRSFSDTVTPLRDNASSNAPLGLEDGQSESCLLAYSEGSGKEHQSGSVPINPNFVPLNFYKTAASLCSTCSECCSEDTALSIGPPVRVVAKCCSTSKVTTKDLLGGPSCRERNKTFEEWCLPSTSSVLVPPSTSLMLQSSAAYSGELPGREEYIVSSSCSDGPPSDITHNKNIQLVLNAHSLDQNVGVERLHSGLISDKMSKLPSSGISNQSQLSIGVAKVTGSTLNVVGKELSLAVASLLDCPKMNVPVTVAGESVSGSNHLARGIDDCIGVPNNKGVLVEELLHRVKELEATLQERSKWAREKVAHAAKRLINDFSELKALRLDREEVVRLKKEKQSLEESSKKKIAEMEITLRKTIGQVECTNTAVRRLEIENAEMRAEMEAAKLSAAESSANDKVFAKREKKALKKEQTWEKQRAKLQEEVAIEKRKLAQLQLELSQVKDQQQTAEVRWRQEVKAKEAAINFAEAERRAKEQIGAAAKRREDALRRKAEADDRRHQDDIARLEDEIAHLSFTRDSSEQILVHSEPSSGVASLSKYTLSMQELRTINSRLLQELADVQSPSGRDLLRDRECVMCMSEERSVVFLPCAHQVICVDCNNLHEAQGMKDCPSCRASIEQRIRVYCANA